MKHPLLPLAPLSCLNETEVADATSPRLTLCQPWALWQQALKQCRTQSRLLAWTTALGMGSRLRSCSILVISCPLKASCTRDSQPNQR